VAGLFVRSAGVAMYGMQSHCGTLASNTTFFLFVTSHANFYWPYVHFIVLPAPGFFGVKPAIWFYLSYFSFPFLLFCELR
jgi:hypothetical protein